jgi:hypothetical protein
MSTATTEAKAATAAYVPFETFENFVSTLNSTLVPDHIDRGMMSNLSGAVQSHLLSALRFLGLVTGKDDKVTDEFRQLVSTYGTDGWNQALQALLKQAYADITVDIGTTTDQKLRGAFETAFKLDGSMLDRAVRFYIQGFKRAGATISPHVGKRKPRGVRKPRGNSGTTNGGTKNPPVQEPKDHVIRKERTKGTVAYPLYFKGKPEGSLVVPEDLSESDCAVIELQLAVLKAYAAQK